MKAKTAAQKRKAKRGRPRMECAREPSGRVSRSGIDHGPADVVALDARRRQLGLSRDQAKDQKAGTFIGYLALLGRRDGISEEQYQAATEYLNLRQSYLRAIGAPGRVLDGEAGRSSEDVTEAYEEWAANTKQSYADCRRSIMDAQMEHRTENLWAALDLVIIQDQRIHNLIGSTRILCNALCRHFRI